MPVRALCLGQVGGGAVGVVAVCSHRTALPSTRFSLCEPTTQLEAHVRNVAQWAELRAGERRSLLRASGRRRREAERGSRGGPRAGPLPQRGRGGGVRHPRRSVPSRRGHRSLRGAERDPGSRPWGSVLCADRSVLVAAVGACETSRAQRRRCTYDGAHDDIERRPRSGAAGGRASGTTVLTRVLEGSPGGTTEPMNIFTTLGRADPELFRRWLGFGGALLSGTLPGRLRELVILRTAFRFGGGYEWAHHIELAEAQGVRATRSQRWATTRARAGSTGRRWSGRPERRGRDGRRRLGV